MGASAGSEIITYDGAASLFLGGDGSERFAKRQRATVVSATDSDRPKPLLEHIVMLARKQPFEACGNLMPNANAQHKECINVIG